MAVTVAINGTTLIPQPRSVEWSPVTVGGKLDVTDAVGAYRSVNLTSPPAAGGTATFNWNSFDNTVLTSIVLPAEGQTMSSGSGTTYNSGVISKPISISDAPGDVLQTSMRVLVIV